MSDMHRLDFTKGTVEVFDDMTPPQGWTKRDTLMHRIDATSPAIELALWHAIQALELISQGTGDPVERARVGLRLMDQTLEDNT